MFAASPPSIKHLVDVQFSLGLVSFIPLSRSLAFAGDQLAFRMPLGVSRLFRCFMGNVIELSIALISVWFCQIKLVSLHCTPTSRRDPGGTVFLTKVHVLNSRLQPC